MKTSATTAQQWAELYKSGKSTYQIATQYGTSPQVVRRNIKKLVRMRTISEAMSSLPAQDIIDKYRSGVSARALTKEYNSTITSITDLLRRNKINVRQPPPTVADWSFIYTRSPFFFYWLGWNLSDGCISYKHTGGRNRGIVTHFVTQTKDAHIVQFFKDRICPSTKTQILANAHSIIISIPRKDADYLARWGFVPRKSKILAPTELLEGMSDAEFYQMLVGFIEGDGCICGKRIHCGIVCASKPWLEFLAKRLSPNIIGSISSHMGAYNFRFGLFGLWQLQCELNRLNIQYRLLTRKWDRIPPFPVFFPDELVSKPHICEHIKNQLAGKNVPLFKIRPQKCIVKLVNYVDVVELYTRYHYIGPGNGVYHIGVYHEDALVAAMSIRRPSRQDSGDWEISRMVCHFDYHIHGLWSYLIKWIKNCKLISGKLITYSDNRLSLGNVYLMMGFTKGRMIPPDYYWVRDGVRYHKSALRKTEEEKKTKYTEVQLRSAQGYSQVWDCGKTKWSMNI